VSIKRVAANNEQRAWVLRENGKQLFHRLRPYPELVPLRSEEMRVQLTRTAESG
jgi:hypothetical protein